MPIATELTFKLVNSVPRSITSQAATNAIDLLSADVYGLNPNL